MGRIQSCIGKRSNKVDVMSEEEGNAYSKMEEEIKKEIMEDSMQTKPLPWMMFCTEHDKTKACAEEVPGSTVTEVMKKRGGMAFNIEYKSSVPKLPPLSVRRVPVTQSEDFEKWKEERDKLLVDKHEQAKIRREKVIQQKKLSAQRPRTARSRDVLQTVPLSEIP
nr:uncharacterized protein LOC117693083 [Crassostrea gigas]